MPRCLSKWLFSFTFLLVLSLWAFHPSPNPSPHPQPLLHAGHLVPPMYTIGWKGEVENSVHPIALSRPFVLTWPPETPVPPEVKSSQQPWFLQHTHIALTNALCYHCSYSTRGVRTCIPVLLTSIPFAIHILLNKYL